MVTLQGMRSKVSWIQEKIRQQAINDTFEEWQKATRNYYNQGYDNGETTKFYKQLENLGVDMGIVFDKDLEIRDQILKEKEINNEFRSTKKSTKEIR